MRRTARHNRRDTIRMPGDRLRDSRTCWTGTVVGGLYTKLRMPYRRRRRRLLPVGRRVRVAVPVAVCHSSSSCAWSITAAVVHARGPRQPALTRLLPSLGPLWAWSASWAWWSWPSACAVAVPVTLPACLRVRGQCAWPPLGAHGGGCCCNGSRRCNRRRGACPSTLRWATSGAGLRGANSLFQIHAPRCLHGITCDMRSKVWSLQCTA